MSYRGSIVLPALFLTIVLCNPTRSADWPNWRGPEHNGFSEEEIALPLPDTFPIEWKVQIGIGFCTVSVVGNRVLTMGNSDDKDTIWCLDSTTGKVLWKHAYDCDLDPRYYEGGPGGTPTIHEGAVYTLSKKGHAFRLDLETGEVSWKRDLIADHGFDLPEWSFACSPLIAGDRVLLNVGRGGLALSKETGETLWMPSTETSGYATVVPSPEDSRAETHLIFSAKALIALDAATGKELWNYPWKSSRDVNAADPIVIGNQILLSSSGGSELLAFPEGEAATAPEAVWKQHDMKWYFNPGVVIGDHVYSLHGTTHRPTELMCTNWKTGEIVWIEEGYGSGGLTAAGEIIIVFDNGILTLFKADPEGFQLLLKQPVMEGKCWTSPVLANGRIYCRNAEGTLVAIRIPTG